MKFAAEVCIFSREETILFKQKDIGHRSESGSSENVTREFPEMPGRRGRLMIRR